MHLALQTESRSYLQTCFELKFVERLHILGIGHHHNQALVGNLHRDNSRSAGQCYRNQFQNLIRGMQCRAIDVFHAGNFGNCPEQFVLPHQLSFQQQLAQQDKLALLLSQRFLQILGRDVAPLRKDFPESFPLHFFSDSFSFDDDRDRPIVSRRRDVPSKWPDSPLLN